MSRPSPLEIEISHDIFGKLIRILGEFCRVVGKVADGIAEFGQMAGKQVPVFATAEVIDQFKPLAEIGL